MCFSYIRHRPVHIANSLCLRDDPLHDARIVATGTDQTGVIVHKGHRGHMTAVSAVRMRQWLHSQIQHRKNRLGRTAAWRYSIIFTFGCTGGYAYNFTLPQSSPLTISVWSLLRHTVFTSVPSAFSGQTPSDWNVSGHVCVAQTVSRIDDGVVNCLHVPEFPASGQCKMHWFSNDTYSVMAQNQTHSTTPRSLRNSCESPDYLPTSRDAW